MKLQFIFLTVLLCLGKQLYGQNATITFRTNKDITVSIYAPLDKACNIDVITDKIELRPHIRATYELPVSDFCFVLCTYSNGNRYFLILQENDNLMVDFSEEQILCQGSNAEGMAFFDQTFNGMGKFVDMVNEIFDQRIDVSKNIEAIPDDINKKMIVPTFDQINQLYLNKKITLTFKQILEKNFLYSTYGNVTHVFNWLLADKDKRLDDKDILWATHYLDSLYSALPPFDESILKYVFSYKYLKGYYKRIYKGLNQDERDNLLGKYSSDTFGPYKHYLLCPESFLSSLFGDAIIAELTLGIDFFFEKTDKDKFVGYFEENYPKSQFLPAIKKKMQEMKKAEMVTTDGTDSIIILENRISSLKDLPSIKNLKGKYLFVDLWATWCIPCKQEFQHKQDLDKVLVQYQNIVPLYISIDKDALDESWRKNINQYALTGYHIRASEALQNDILQQVNNSSKSLAIPRYMLLDDSGNIVNDNMPRPSAIDILKKELDKLM